MRQCLQPTQVARGLQEGASCIGVLPEDIFDRFGDGPVMVWSGGLLIPGLDPQSPCQTGLWQPPGAGQHPNSGPGFPG